MIDLEKLNPILKGYKSYFPSHWDKEKYKWDAVKHFQDHWDIDAGNFGNMFKKATDKTFNLLASGYAYPRVMITNFAKADDEATRTMFRNLFDESQDLAARVDAFQVASEELRSRYDDGTWKNHYQNMIRFLPIMQTDIMLRLKDQILIIDAKYYGKTLQQQYDKYTLHSNNVYQIFTYVKNLDRDNTGQVAGILLYAKTDEDITPDCMFNMGGNQIGAKTLDLNKEFPLIAAQLNHLAESIFKVKAA